MKEKEIYHFQHNSDGRKLDISVARRQPIDHDIVQVSVGVDCEKITTTFNFLLAIYPIRVYNNDKSIHNKKVERSTGRLQYGRR